MSSVALVLRRSWRALAAYAAFTAWGLACLALAVGLSGGARALHSSLGGMLPTLLGIGAAAVVGHVAGSALGLLRLRLWVVAVVASTVALALGLGAHDLGADGDFLVVAAVAAAGGYAGVASRLEVLAAWLPLTYAVGAAVLWMNTHGKVSAWLSGAKYAVWDPLTFVFLAGAVLLFLVFLLTRHALALSLWRGGRGTDDVARAGRGSAFVLVTMTGFLVATTALLSPFLFRTDARHGSSNGATTTAPHYVTHYSAGAPPPVHVNAGGYAYAGTPHPPAPPPPDAKPSHACEALSGAALLDCMTRLQTDAPPPPTTTTTTATATGPLPYYTKPAPVIVDAPAAPLDAPWQATTAPVASAAPATTAAAPVATPIPDGGDLGDDGAAFPRPDMARAAVDGAKAARTGVSLLAVLAALVAALSAAALALFRPTRRAILLRHLERPLWPTTPTRRVENLWLRALVALDDLGIEPRGDETPEKLAIRAAGVLTQRHGEVPKGIDAAARIIERVEYAGRGLSPDEEGKMRVAVVAFLAYAARHVGAARGVTRAWAPVRAR